MDAAKISGMFELSGKTALVTGSSRGIGRAIAETLAAAGARVLVHGSHPGGKLTETVKSIRENGGMAEELNGDLGDPEAVKNILSAAGDVDILILNASVQAYQTLEDFSIEEFRRQYEINVRSSFELVNGVLPSMRSRGWGRLLAIGSVNQWKPSPRLPIYSTSKCALAALMMACARHYAAFGITANNLAPGVICTDRNEAALEDEEFRRQILAMIPAGYFGAPQDCAGLALLLCSNAGRYITGADIPLTGGMHL